MGGHPHLTTGSSFLSTFMLRLATSRPRHIARCLHWAKSTRGVSSSVFSDSILTMPSLSPVGERYVIRQWYVRPGEMVEAGDVLAYVETENMSVEWEAYEDGHI